MTESEVFTVSTSTISVDSVVECSYVPKFLVVSLSSVPEPLSGLIRLNIGLRINSLSGVD